MGMFNKKEKRFVEILSEGVVTTNKIIKDNDTGVLYLFHNSGYAGGLTVLVDRDGKPLVGNRYTE